MFEGPRKPVNETQKERKYGFQVKFSRLPELGRPNKRLFSLLDAMDNHFRQGI